MKINNRCICWIAMLISLAGLLSISFIIGKIYQKSIDPAIIAITVDKDILDTACEYHSITMCCYRKDGFFIYFKNDIEYPLFSNGFRGWLALKESEEKL